jgi:hypothetical protein
MRVQDWLLWARRGFANGLVLALTLVFTSGCALFGRNPDLPFKTVAIVGQGESDTDLEADTYLKAGVTGMTAGAVGGAGTGAGLGALFGLCCGPFAPACVPSFAATGATGGAIAGGTLGILIGGLQGLPSEKAEQVTEILVGLAKRRNLREELRSAVQRKVPPGRRASLQRADAVATVRLTDLDLEQHLSEKISIRMEAKMEVECGPKCEKDKSQSYDYKYETPERHVDEWLANKGVDFGASFTEGIRLMASQMSRDLFSGKQR